ncbi:uncharacterized protein LOC135098503 [Scylla paramamosain]|uniref:uncharacterized protein LOC135098503 n=1 Tax=Scylla paramamosain TaxID=85552 RepID=UPI003083C917
MLWWTAVWGERWMPSFSPLPSLPALFLACLPPSPRSSSPALPCPSCPRPRREDTHLGVSRILLTHRGDNWWAVCGECHIVCEGPSEPHSTSCNSYSSSSSRRKWHPPSTSPSVTGASSSSSSWPGCRDRMSKQVVTERVASLSLPPATQPQHWQLLQ